MKTHWTKHHVLWGDSWINIRLMMADAPGYDVRKKEEEVRKIEDKELINILNKWNHSSR